MNRRQKLVQQQFLNNEQAVIKRLEYIYDQALAQIQNKIHNLEFMIGDLNEAYDWADDAEKEIIKSKIQSKIYQKRYQQSLQDQLDGILQKMRTEEFLTVSDYLDLCYEDGFVGSLFDLHGQDIPLMMPLNQESMVRAVQLESKISKGLYTRLGEDVAVLKKRIASEVTRSIATGSSWPQMAKRLENSTRIGYNNSIRIARTEGHRIQCTAADDAAHEARDRGADVAKQWDATLDGKTRPSHRRVDGEIKDLDERFSNGLEFPGDPAGTAKEVINCRCAYLQRARWALDGEFTKWNNFTGQLESFDSPDAYKDFRKGFFSDENVKYMDYVQRMQDKYKTKDMRKLLDQMSEREYQQYSNLLGNNPVYNKKKAPVFTPATVDDFPEIFRKNAQGKKATKTFVDALNANTDLDPNIRKLYTHMGDLPNIPRDSSISYTGTGHELGRWQRGNVLTKAKLKVPKMEGDDLAGQLSTAFHEMGHFIDMGANNTWMLKSEQWKDLTDVVKASGKNIPKDAMDLFTDFHKEYDGIRDTLSKEYRAKRQVLTDAVRAGTLPYSDYKKQWNALVREEDAVRDYQCRNLFGGGVSMLSDIYDALSGGSYRDSGTLYYGHGGKYYRDLGNRNCEIFANYMSLSVNNPDLLEILRKDKPDLCDALDKLIEEMAGELK